MKARSQQDDIFKMLKENKNFIASKTIFPDIEQNKILSGE